MARGLGTSARDVPMPLTLNNFDRWAVVPHNLLQAAALLRASARKLERTCNPILRGVYNFR